VLKAVKGWEWRVFEAFLGGGTLCCCTAWTAHGNDKCISFIHITYLATK